MEYQKWPVSNLPEITEKRTDYSLFQESCLTMNRRVEEESL